MPCSTRPLDALPATRPGGYDARKEYQTLRDRIRRNEILARLEAFETRQAERNKDLSDTEIEELADRATREAFAELVAEGKLVVERDRR